MLLLIVLLTTSSWKLSPNKVTLSVLKRATLATLTAFAVVQNEPRSTLAADCYSECIKLAPESGDYCRTTCEDDNDANEGSVRAGSSSTSGSANGRLASNEVENPGIFQFLPDALVKSYTNSQVDYASNQRAK